MANPKKKSLSAALASAEPEPVAAAPAAPEQGRVAPSPPRKQANRDGQKMISGWFPMPVSYELEELRLARTKELGRKVTLQQLQAEAYNDLFKKYGRPELAPTRAA